MNATEESPRTRWWTVGLFRVAIGRRLCSSPVEGILLLRASSVAHPLLQTCYGVVSCIYSCGYGSDWAYNLGIVDKGETPEQAALRELTEETGYVGECIDVVFVGSFHH